MTFPSDFSPQNPPKRPPPPAAYVDASIDEWQRKINDDFNRLYLSLYQNPSQSREFAASSPPAFNPMTDHMSQNTIRQDFIVPQVIVTDFKDKRAIEQINKTKQNQNFLESIDLNFFDGKQVIKLNKQI